MTLVVHPNLERPLIGSCASELPVCTSLLSSPRKEIQLVSRRLPERLSGCPYRCKTEPYLEKVSPEKYSKMLKIKRQIVHCILVQAYYFQSQSKSQPDPMMKGKLLYRMVSNRNPLAPSKTEKEDPIPDSTNQ